MQTSLSLQSAAVAQRVQVATEPSGGQSALLPVQYSAGSHGPADGRQTVDDDWKPSGGQPALLPVQ